MFLDLVRIPTGVILAGGLILLSTTPASAQTHINFDDGVSGAVGAHYQPAAGVTFQNPDFRAYTSFFPGGEPWASMPGSRPTLIHSSSDMWWTPAVRPIKASFDVGVDVGAVSILALDVGVNGARLAAFDEDNNEIAFDLHAGTGNGWGQTKKLTVTGSGIRRVEFYQAFALDNGDGIGWDDFSFTSSARLAEIAAAPEPATMTLMAPALGLIGFLRKRRRKDAEVSEPGED